MPLLIVAFTLVVILAGIALTPLALVQRFRVGTARRRAREWSATVNAAGLAFSSALFLAGAGMTSLWVPNALTVTLMGFGSLHYAPNRWLSQFSRAALQFRTTVNCAVDTPGPATTVRNRWPSADTS